MAKYAVELSNGTIRTITGANQRAVRNYVNEVVFRNKSEVSIVNVRLITGRVK